MRCTPATWTASSPTTPTDIVMFDVPPPNDGIRGLDAYRAAWPPFFSWQASGARFEIVSLDVTAGEDVAFAYALLRCNTDEELRDDPDQPAAADRRPTQGRRALARDPRAPLVPRQGLRAPG